MTTHIIVHEGARMSFGEMTLAYRDTFVAGVTTNYDHVRGTRIAPGYTGEMFEKWIEKLSHIRDTDCVFAILVHEDSPAGRAYRYIGHTGIHDIGHRSGSGRTGSVIPFPEMCGKGYGKEAKLLLQMHAFQVLGLATLDSDVKSFNAQSLGHLLACGYMVYGREPDTQKHDGAVFEKILLTCHRASWEPLWQQYQESGTLPTLSVAQRALVTKETT